MVSLRLRRERAVQLDQPNLDLAVHDQRELVMGAGAPLRRALGANRLQHSSHRETGKLAGQYRLTPGRGNKGLRRQIVYLIGARFLERPEPDEEPMSMFPVEWLTGLVPGL